MDQKPEFDSPFLSEELFAEEPEERWEPRVSALASGSPFQTAFHPVAAAIDEIDVFPDEGGAHRSMDQTAAQKEFESLYEESEDVHEDFDAEASVLSDAPSSHEADEFTGDDQSYELVEMESPPRLPPRTKPRTEQATIGFPPQNVLVDITIEVLPDKVNPSIENSGTTRCAWKQGSVQFRAPEVAVEIWRDRWPQQKLVRSIRTPPQASATLTIQTSYKRRGVDRGRSGYGRGTTQEDKRNRNTSLGFHEWCHRMACIRYLQTQTLPEFSGSVGMKEPDFLKAWTNFMSEFRSLPSKIHAYSGQQVDEVGNPTKSEYDRRRSRRRRETSDENEEFVELDVEDSECEEPEWAEDASDEEEGDNEPEWLAEDVDEDERTGQGDEDNLDTPFSLEREGSRKVKSEIILVAGTNYPKFEKSGSIWKRVRQLSPGPWRKYCLTLAHSRLKQNSNLKVTLFDFFAGTRENVVLSANGKVLTSIERQFTKPIPDDYWNLVGLDENQPFTLMSAKLEPANKSPLRNKEKIGYFDGATALAKGGSIGLVKYVNDVRVTAPVISITDVYSYIESLARSGKKGALEELHFFSHAFNILTSQYSGGPILLNSLDDPRDPNTRWKLDKDARAAKDFKKPAMDPSVFAQAFGPNARSFVWGCNFQRGFIRQFVNQIGKNAKVLAAARPMKISHTSDWGDISEFRTKLGLTEDAAIRNVSVSLTKITQILNDTNAATYMQKLATASGRPAVGAPPGTYASPDGPGSPLELHHIPMTRSPFRNAKETDNFEPVLLVMKERVGLSFDKSFGDHHGLGRGYIIFNP